MLNCSHRIFHADGQHNFFDLCNAYLHLNGEYYTVDHDKSDLQKKKIVVITHEHQFTFISCLLAASYLTVVPYLIARLGVWFQHREYDYTIYTEAPLIHRASTISPSDEPFSPAFSALMQSEVIPTIPAGAQSTKGEIITDSSFVDLSGVPMQQVVPSLESPIEDLPKETSGVISTPLAKVSEKITEKAQSLLVKNDPLIELDIKKDKLTNYQPVQ